MMQKKFTHNKEKGFCGFSLRGSKWQYMWTLMEEQEVKVAVKKAMRQCKLGGYTFLSVTVNDCWVLIIYSRCTFFYIPVVYHIPSMPGYDHFKHLQHQLHNIHACKCYVSDQVCQDMCTKVDPQIIESCVTEALGHNTVVLWHGTIK